ncbi:uncharacterized protein LALA0_S10e02938g [Lachancea lanzarotensis]|uniref:LALA0S10e02938g1_1 n=1 Tax=Lachancea lanzarotensis TaxID=1245769 RepID=A0A0C7NCN3_9SACH|nr:uncharacterized protein LALA0_S10e02938g [Lachancea lanzarotensis]CEP64122.1 LALA0S10e02938g1_1 [Lachancea lanzarotensis]
MATNKTDLSAEQRRLVHQYYRELRDFSTVTGGKLDRSSSARAQKARSKLLKLYSSQFFELSTDVHDELQRRIDENQTQPDHLLPKDNFHVKRNQARQKLANLSESRFNDLVDDILYEIQRRDYHILSEPQTPVSPQISPRVSPQKNHFRPDEGEVVDPNVSSQSVVHTDPRNSVSRNLPLDADSNDNSQHEDMSTPKKSSIQDGSTHSSSVVPSTSIQQSQVIPKKASIEWSSDEEEDHHDGGKESRSARGTSSQDIFQDRDIHSVPESRHQDRTSGIENNVTDFAQRSQLLQDSDNSDFENGSQNSPQFGAGKTQGQNHALSGSNHRSSREHTNGQVDEDASFEETKGLSLTNRLSQSVQSPSIAGEASEEGLRFSDRFSSSIVTEKMEDSDLSKRDSPSIFDSLPRGSHLKFAPGPNSSNGFDEQSSPENAGKRQNTSSPTMSINSPFDTRERSELGSASSGLQTQLKHLGSIKRISLENENSQREIQVLIAEGTKMDEKITELELNNSQLSAAKKHLENELRTQENQNSDLKEQLEVLSKNLIDSEDELQKLKTAQTQGDQTSRSVDRTHHDEFLNITKQVNSLSIENENLKQDLAEMELKLKKHSYDEKPANARDNATPEEVSNESFRSEALDKVQNLPKKYLSPEGLIPSSLLTAFISHIENMFHIINRNRQDTGFGHQIFNVLSQIVDTVQKVIETVDNRGSQEHILVLKGALSHAITAVRFFASFHEILPLVTVNSAVSDVTFALCQMVDIVKVADVHKDNFSLDQNNHIVPQTPNAQDWSEFEDANFQDPRESLQGVSNNPGNMSPVKPLKITQKVVNNAQPSKGRHTSRKPSSSLFGSIVNTSSTANNSPETVQFPKARSGSPASKQEVTSSPAAAKDTSQSQKYVAASSASTRWTDTVSSPISPSLNVFSQGKKLTNTDNSTVKVAKLTSASAMSSLSQSDRIRAEPGNSAAEKIFEASTDEGSTDENERNNDDSNLTSDEDLTYQLKQNLLKSQKPKDFLEGENAEEYSIPLNSPSKASPQARNVTGQDTKTVNTPVKSTDLGPSVDNGPAIQPETDEEHAERYTTKGDEGFKLTPSTQSTNKLSFVSDSSDTSNGETTGKEVHSGSRIADVKRNIPDDCLPAKGTQVSEHLQKFANGAPGNDDKSEVNVPEGYSDPISAAPPSTVEQDTYQRFPARWDTNDLKKMNEDPSLKPSDQSISLTPSTNKIKTEDASLESEHILVKQEDHDGWNPSGSRTGSTAPAAASSRASEEVAEGGRESGDEDDFDIDAFDIENPDNTLSELLLYLEHRTIEVISTIQSLLTSIKQPQALKGELCKDSSAINQVIAQMVEATNVSMAQSRNAALKEHGNWVVQSLKDCKRRMTSLCHLNEDGTINFDEGDDEYASKHFKQRLAGIAFDVAKCTKELVKTVEEASLKEEIEYLNSQLKH